jgi:hypothetical protein
MLRWEEFVELRNLHERGWSVSAIARHLGVSHGRWGTANSCDTGHSEPGGPWHARGPGRALAAWQAP